jgi:hypothetical protein
MSKRRPINQLVVSSVRVELAEHHGREHDEVTVFNRGGSSGKLRLAPGDGKFIPDLLRAASGPARMAKVPPEVITSAVSRYVGRHDRIQVFNRGKLAGQLTVVGGDGETIARALRGGRDAPPQPEEKSAQVRKTARARENATTKLKAAVRAWEPVAARAPVIPINRKARERARDDDPAEELLVRAWAELAEWKNRFGDLIGHRDLTTVFRAIERAEKERERRNGKGR